MEITYYKFLNKELTLKYQDMKMSFAILRTEVLNLRREIFQCRVEKKKLCHLVMQVIQHNTEKYNTIINSLTEECTRINASENIRKSIAHIRPSITEQSLNGSSDHNDNVNGSKHELFYNNIVRRRRHSLSTRKDTQRGTNQLNNINKSQETDSEGSSLDEVQHVLDTIIETNENASPNSNSSNSSYENSTSTQSIGNITITRGSRKNRNIVHLSSKDDSNLDANEISNFNISATLCSTPYKRTSSSSRTANTDTTNSKRLKTADIILISNTTNTRPKRKVAPTNLTEKNIKQKLRRN